MPRPKSLKKKLSAEEFYCVSCRGRKRGDEIHYREVKNSKRGKVPMLSASCKSCGHNLNKFVKVKDADKLKKKYA